MNILKQIKKVFIKPKQAKVVSLPIVNQKRILVKEAVLPPSQPSFNNWWKYLDKQIDKTYKKERI